MDDAELVQTARSGDTQAWAAIYDRYTDRIHDFAYATLRDRAEAAEVVQGTFAIALERLAQLREPGRLGPWLLAIAHHAVLVRAADPNRPPAPASGPPAPATEHPSRDELAEFVWHAAADLGAWDRALLDLYLRQELDGDDLADAAGMTPSDMATTLNRLLNQVERSLGALLVARSNRRSCARLAEILTGWEGVLTPELEGRITGHVDDCEVCNSRRRLVLNPLGLLAGVPTVPAPAPLRRTVLGGAGRAAWAGWIFNADGFPYQGGDRQADTGALPAAPRSRSDRDAPTTAYTRVNAYRAAPTTVTPTPPMVLPVASPWQKRDRRPAVVGALAGVIVLVAGILALLAARGPGKPGQVAVSVPTTAAPETTIPPTTRPAPTTTTRPPAPATVPPGHFVVGAKGLDFGTTGVSQSLMVSNDGAGPLTFSAVAPNAALTIVPANGSIEPNASTTLTVTLNRANAPPGPLSTTVAITSGSGTAIISVTAIVDPGPSITGEQATPATLIVNSCLPTATGSTKATVTAQVSAPFPLTGAGALLHSQPMSSGSDTANTMALNGTNASGSIGSFPTPGPVDWWITATDTKGVSVTTIHHTITVGPCPP